ncbi:MAG: hypothetical protein KKB13_11385 [Chloroflexi bacterium]|nr:hypothetical protein [Chloroflexota bacterium]
MQLTPENLSGVVRNLGQARPLDFAQTFYGRLLAGLAIRPAVQEARAAIRLLGDPTGLAYTVFADLVATVPV